MLLETLRPVLTAKNETERRAELIGSGSVDVWSLDSPDAGRGRKYACVVVDEAALIPNLEDAWQQSIRPTLTDLQGDAWFLSTPRGVNNYFHQLFQYGQDPERENWASWQMPTSANPFIDPAELEDAQRDLTDLAFSQEYLARFVSWEGAVFRKILDAVWNPPAELKQWVRPAPYATWAPTFSIGVDWARGARGDYTVFCVACSLPPIRDDRNPGKAPVLPSAIVEIDRFRGVEYALQRSRLQALWHRYGCPVVLAEQNSIGGPQIEQLRRDGVPVRPFTTTNSTKAKIIDALALGLEQETLKIPNDPALIGELQSFEARTLPSGLIQYSAPEGGHDDLVIGSALAYHALQRYAHAHAMDPYTIDRQREFGLRLALGGFRSTF